MSCNKVTTCPRIGDRGFYFPKGRKDLNTYHPAVIATVWGSQCVNVGYVDSNGSACSATSVKFVNSGEDAPDYPFVAPTADFSVFAK